MATKSSGVGISTLTTLENIEIDMVQVFKAPVDKDGKTIPGKRDRATGRITQYNALGNKQWSRFFVTWDCVSQVNSLAVGEPNDAEPVLGVAENTAPITHGDMSDESDANRNRKRVEYNRLYTVIGSFESSRSKTGDNKWYENFVISEIH